MLTFSSLLDHDECSGVIDDCSQICNNHVGGYTCSCFLGCTLLSDGANCTGKIVIILRRVLCTKYFINRSLFSHLTEEANFLRSR